jgi:hypothetical protein
MSAGCDTAAGSEANSPIHLTELNLELDAQESMRP